jgi:anti-sigma28 factor (negative regulator of flagellin synthesis)
MIVEFGPRVSPSSLEEGTVARVSALRDQVRRGSYRVDPLQVAQALYESLRSGGV